MHWNIDNGDLVIGPAMGWNYPTHFNHEHSQENNTNLSKISSHYSQYILAFKKICRGHETCLIETAPLFFILFIFFFLSF